MTGQQNLSLPKAVFEENIADLYPGVISSTSFFTTKHKEQFHQATGTESLRETNSLVERPAVANKVSDLLQKHETQ